MIFTRWVVLVAALFVALAAGTSAADRIRKADGPTSLQTRDTWWETMLASREALAEQEAAAERQAEADRLADPVLKECQPFRIELNTQQEPRKIRVRIAGLRRLYVGCAGQFHVFLGEPQLIGRDGKAVPLPLAKARVPTDQDLFRHSGMRHGWQPIVSGQQKYATGFTMRDWEICVELDGQAEWLEGTLGAPTHKEIRKAEFWVQCRSLAEVKAKAVAAREAIVVAVAGAFPSPADLRQQRVEARADIWKTDWKRGDLADLASRYAGACGPDQKPSAQEIAKQCQSVAELKTVRDLFYGQYIRERLGLARKTLAMVERAAPRPELAEELAALEKELAASKGRSNGESLHTRVCNLRRKIILSHPALDFPKLLINKRSGFLPEHMVDQYLGRHSQEAPGLVVLEGWRENPRETVLLAGKLPRGCTITPDLSYDGKRVLFAFADHSHARDDDLFLPGTNFYDSPTNVEDSGARYRGYLVYEYSFETGKVRQVTGTAADPMARSSSSTRAKGRTSPRRSPRSLPNCRRPRGPCRAAPLRPPCRWPTTFLSNGLLSTQSSFPAAGPAPRGLSARNCSFAPTSTAPNTRCT
ncbi:MAG: hypothetical protein FJ290_00665 [Planctomycetes bacterium]|nr:hypothetical protein [Planctomycetota bacterium]